MNKTVYLFGYRRQSAIFPFLALITAVGLYCLLNVCQVAQGQSNLIQFKKFLHNPQIKSCMQEAHGHRFQACKLSLDATSIRHASHESRYQPYRHLYDITLVTMYLNPRNYSKGSGPDNNHDWAKHWERVTNQVIAFFDDDEILARFKFWRSRQPTNHSIFLKINRSDLPAFVNLEMIKKLYASPKYLKHLPNMVHAEYTCMMNAKYDILQKALDLDLVTTEFLAWMDLSVFRRTPKHDLHLEVPDGFDATTLGFSEVTPRKMVSTLSPWDYIKSDSIWVASGFILGTHTVIRKFIRAYRETVVELLNQGLSGTDQQIIGAMYSPQMIQSQSIKISAYGQRSRRGYYSLPYICKKAAEMRRRTANTTVV